MKTLRAFLKPLAWKYFELFKSGDQLAEAKLAGKTLTVVKGTFRDKTDQDDAWYFELTKHSTHVFDIGANVGYTGLLAAVNEKTQSILLVDPNPLALSWAAKNLILNNFEHKCRFFNAFVSDSIGEKIKFYAVGSGQAGSMFKGHSETAAALNTYFMVKTVTLDYLSDYFNILPDFVKVDVEGAESFVLQGAKQLAAKNQTRFMVEMHSPPELPMVENATKVLAWCVENNYTAWYMKTYSELKDPTVLADRGKCHLLLQPTGWTFPEFLKSIQQGAPLS
jgi:FkbM family methyltransferase